MSRTFLRQNTQISASVNFDDSLSSGVSLQSGSYTLESDLNSIRSQLRRVLFSTSSAGKWYDDLPDTGAGKRGIEQLGLDLYDIEAKRFLFRTQLITDIPVSASQNWVVLDVSQGQAPSYVAAVTAQATGTVTFVLPSGSFAAHNMGLVSGTNILTPRNLAVVVTASTGNPLQAATGEDIYALVQSISGTTDGDVFNDTTKKVQLSFVVANSTRTALTAANVSDIAGKTINYSYVRRIALDNIPEDAYLDGVFVDAVYDLSSALQSAVATLSASVSLDSAIDNQSGPATQTDRNIEVRISTPYSWSFGNSAGTQQFLTVDSSNSSVKFNVSYFDVLNSQTAQYLNAIRTSVSGNWVQVGAGTVNASGSLTVAAATSSLLTLSGGSGISFFDDYKLSSTYTGNFLLANDTADWNNFVTDFGQATLFEALHALSQSITGTKGQLKATAVVTPIGGIAADGNVSYPTNIDSPLLNLIAYQSASFVSGVNVYVNGQLMRGGVNSSDNHDVYLGTSPTNGDLKFEFKLHKDDVITVIIPN